VTAGIIMPTLIALPWPRGTVPVPLPYWPSARCGIRRQAAMPRNASSRARDRRRGGQCNPKAVPA